jgi:hypothetical protein
MMAGIKPGKLVLGVVLLGSFVAVLVAIFMPLIGGENALNYLDNLYNSISKGSANYFAKVRHMIEEHPGGAVALTLRMESPADAATAAAVLSGAAETVSVAANEVRIAGDLDALLLACLDDAQTMYDNNGAAIAERYGMHEKVALHGWWKVLGAMEKDFNRQKLFAAAKLADTVKTKTVECAYNYYGIEAQRIGERWGIVLFSLIFYVVYTVWYGYAVMFVFEGLGYRLGAH